jgi:pilus assembly protein CpaE
MSGLFQAKKESRVRSTSAPQTYETPRSDSDVATNTSPYPVNPNPYPDSIGAKQLSIALISPNLERRAAAALALTRSSGGDVSEFPNYPPGLDDVGGMLGQRFDVVIIELDSDPEYALELVESIGSDGLATVMVYSASADPELLVRCMRAGAREFLTLPLAPEVMAEALVRAAARRPVMQSTRKTAGRLLAFLGAKGGAGATMLACNFAVGLAKDSEEKTLLIDLDVPLGDAALNLGISPEFSTIDALDAAERMDGRFLTQLLVKHSSGLMVLAAPGRFVHYKASDDSINRLLQVARQEFDNVVVDLGSKLDLMGTAAYRDATALYLVTQASIPELRNSNRLISQFFSSGGPKLEIVINRFESRSLGVAEEHITKALTRPPQWKIPNDYAAVRNMQINATPLVLSDSAISRQIRQMVNAVTGKSQKTAKKKGFGLNLFG